MKFYFLALFTIGIVSVFTQVQAKSDALPAKSLESQVYSIIQQKCAPCHDTDWMNIQNPNIPAKARGKFDHILDLQELVKQKKYIIPGDIEHSFLIQKIQGVPKIKGEKMPPVESDYQLSAQEIKLIINWVLQLPKLK